jgi:hypothetical protein
VQISLGNVDEFTKEVAGTIIRRRAWSKCSVGPILASGPEGRFYAKSTASVYAPYLLCSRRIQVADLIEKFFFLDQ